MVREISSNRNNK